MTERTCKRCDAALGDRVHKCPRCGQLNATAYYIISTVIALAFGMMVFAMLIAWATA